MTTTPGVEPNPPRKRPPRKKADLAETLQGIIAEHGLRFASAEGSEERRSRLSIEEARAAHELRRDWLVLRFSPSASSTLVVACFVTLLWPGQSVTVQTWATSTLTVLVTAITSGFVGFSLGKSHKSS